MRNKKGQLFSLIIIALLILFFVSYEVYSIINRESVKTRVKTMDSFLFSIEQNLGRQLYIVGFRTIFLSQNHITETGEYIQNFTSLFNEAIFNGTIYGNSSTILTGTTLSDIQKDIRIKARKMNLNLSLSNIDLWVGQKDPWHVTIILNVTLNLTDQAGLARWYKNESIKSKISIESFRDPLYLISTNGKIARKINKTIYNNYVSGSNVENLTSHLENGYYDSNPNAPSFIDRLEGRLEGNENGIESFANLPDLSSQGLEIKEKTVVDYIYFSPSNPTSYQISGMPSWFRIDENHLDNYQVEELIQ